MDFKQITSQLYVNFYMVKNDNGYIKYHKKNKYQELIWELFLKELEEDKYYIIAPESYKKNVTNSGHEYKKRIIFSDGFGNLEELKEEVIDYLEEQELTEEYFDELLETGNIDWIEEE